MILLDIIVLSELIKALPEAAVERWFLMHEEESHLPSSVIGELAFGVAKLEAGLRKSKFEAQISEWRIRFAERTYAYDVPAALAYGELLANALSGLTHVSSRCANCSHCKGAFLQWLRPAIQRTSKPPD